jgi:hypothetical protein
VGVVQVSLTYVNRYAWTFFYSGGMQMKFDIIRVENNVLWHKQIEKRDGKTFMRMRKMPVCPAGSSVMCA